jgi:hypothetical protein
VNSVLLLALKGITFAVKLNSAMETSIETNPYIIGYEQTPWSKILLENLIVAQRVRICYSFRTRRSIAVFTLTPTWPYPEPVASIEHPHILFILNPY